MKHAPKRRGKFSIWQKYNTLEGALFSNMDRDKKKFRLPGRFSEISALNAGRAIRASLFGAASHGGPPQLELKLAVPPRKRAAKEKGPPVRTTLNLEFQESDRWTRSGKEQVHSIIA
jgi:hypothetical protein